MAKRLSALANGSLVKDTGSTYYGVPIIWRVADKNHSGYPANSVTLISDKIIKIAGFDAGEANNADSSRAGSGNNRYRSSNLRQWLNSMGAASSWWTAQNLTDGTANTNNQDAAPTSTNMSGFNGYYSQAGFKTNLSVEFRAAILSTTLTVVKNTITDGGGTETVTDDIFLASTTEVGLGNENNIVEGSMLAIFNDGDSRLANPTSQAVSNSNYKGGGIKDSSRWIWWLRTPYASTSHGTRLVSTTGALQYGAACFGSGAGVRPLCNLPSDFLVSDAPDADGVYVIQWNRPPATPPSITLPATINGGVSFELSWGESTDADGNLSGYKVDKSIDGGSTWAQIYQGTLLKTTDTAAFGTASVIYRVKAYDSEGAESAYQTSPTRTVINNTAPTAPGSITVPTAVIGGDPLVIVWTGATDGESNLSGYELSRSVAGAAFAVIYKGANLFYNDTITKGWTTVAYRVRAYDTQNAYSNYTTGPTRTVDNVTAPSISSGASGDMGTQNGGITWQYSIAQAESLTTTVTEALDGATIRTYTATLGAANTFTLSGGAWQKILNGAHTMKITATAGGKTSTHTVTFTKAVYAIKVTLDEPLPSETLAGKIVVTVNGSVPGDAVLQVLATNNANDPSPVWEDITASVASGRNYLFTNTAAANGPAVNFIVNVSRGPSGLPVYISSIGGAFE